jgi:hypothetical protein
MAKDVDNVTDHHFIPTKCNLEAAPFEVATTFPI